MEATESTRDFLCVKLSKTLWSRWLRGQKYHCPAHKFHGTEWPPPMNQEKSTHFPTPSLSTKTLNGRRCQAKISSDVQKKIFRGIYRHVCVGLHLIKACTTANYQNVKNPQECDLPSRVFMPSIIEIFKSLSECGRQPWYSGHQNTGCYWGSQWSWSSHIPLNSCGSPCSPKKRMIPGPEQPHISSSTFFKIQMHLSNICTYFPSLIKINTRYKSRWWREHTFFTLSHTAS